jgi:hypothetical protein
MIKQKQAVNIAFSLCILEMIKTVWKPWNGGSSAVKNGVMQNFKMVNLVTRNILMTGPQDLRGSMSRHT